MQTPPAFATSGLGLSYGGRPVLRDISLEVAPGSVQAIVGPSGSGKSSFLTTLNRLSDLVARARVEGRIEIGGVDVRDPSTDVVALRRRVGMIFQAPNPFPLSIGRNLDLPLSELGLGRRERAAAIERALADVGLADEVAGRLDEPAASLSGGQQQRLCLARAIALEPAALLLDEPTSALDPIAGGVVEDLIGRLRGRYTILLVTHDLAQARRLADRVAVFWPEHGVGRLVEEGPVEAVFDDPRSPITAAYVQAQRF